MKKNEYFSTKKTLNTYTKRKMARNVNMFKMTEDLPFPFSGCLSLCQHCNIIFTLNCCNHKTITFRNKFYKNNCVSFVETFHLRSI